MPVERRYPAEKVVRYEPGWPEQYRALSDSLRCGLPGGWAIEHVGSTSVPGLSAKPVIDMALRAPAGSAVRDWNSIFPSLGWTAPYPVGAHVAVVLLQGGVRRAIGHVLTAEQWPTAPIRLFAEWLRVDPADRRAYDTLKARLVADGVWGADYTDAKAEFVVAAVNRARRARGLPALHGPP